ncbi:hypothetical protein VCJ71_12305 [Alteriqipengyuania sp. WL0013]|uniref:hypothetical protein n=1 Tax=Alteriqipengyuania sp. WL0013 TaxID=3110773 RepID=UPI002B5A3FF9|nr:hypothetical protein [Alteriqipengyuania sp. WL0013]MEB3416845.1 hypothetical protein [Alteriqipengyuania sp. WL0013]
MSKFGGFEGVTPTGLAIAILSGFLSGFWAIYLDFGFIVAAAVFLISWVEVVFLEKEFRSIPEKSLFYYINLLVAGVTFSLIFIALRPLEIRGPLIAGIAPLHFLIFVQIISYFHEPKNH